MKKYLVSLFLLLSSSIGFSQSKAFLQAGVSAGFDKVANEYLEIGIDGGKNKISAVGQSFDTTGINRQYLIGVKYVRAVKLLPNFDALLSLAGKTNVSDISAYVVEPGVGLDFQLGKGVSFITGVTSPITQSSYNQRKATFSGNLGLKLNL